MTISSGNFFRKGDPAGPRPTPYTLTEDTVVTGGQFMLCRVENVGSLTVRGVYVGDFGGAFALDIQDGNARGLYVNGTKLDVSAVPELWGAVNGGGPDPYVWQRFERLDLSFDIKKKLKKAGGEDAWDAWIWTCGWVIDNPATTQTEWNDAYIVWADGNGNMTYSEAAFVKIRDKWFPGQGFNSVRDDINVYPLRIWETSRELLVEEQE